MQIVADTANTYLILANGCDEDGVDLRLPYNLHKVLFWVEVDGRVVGVSTFDIDAINGHIEQLRVLRDSSIRIGYQIGDGPIGSGDLAEAIRVSDKEFGASKKEIKHWNALLEAERAKWRASNLLGRRPPKSQ